MSLFVYEWVQILLSRLDEIQKIVDTRKKKVWRFIRKLGEELDDNFLDHENLMYGSSFTCTGSADEGTAVREDADFDFILRLPPPFVLENFKCSEVDINAGLYKLLFNKPTEGLQYSYEYDEDSVSDYDSEDDDASNGTCEEEEVIHNYNVKNFLNQNGYLKVEDLREAVFAELAYAVKQIGLAEPGVTYDCKKLLSSFRVVITSASGNSIKIDVVPQIRGTVYELPDWNDDLPYIVSQYLAEKSYHVFCSLSYPPWLEDRNYKHLVVQATFSKLESYVIKSSDAVYNAVRLTKTVAKHYHWAKKGLKSVRIKRAAIRLYDALQDSDTWAGYQMILSNIINSLNCNFIDGVLIKDQDIMITDKDVGCQLAKEIKKAKSSICPSNIMKILSEYV